MFKFSDDTKLCHRARNPNDKTELQEDINKLVEWANKWQMNLNVDKYSTMHIGHNNMQRNLTCPINSCPNRSIAGSRNNHHQRPQEIKTNREKMQNEQ